MPWARLTALIEPHYPKGKGGRPPMPLERMLRIYFMQQWFNLSDPQAEDALYDIESMRRFAGIELAEDAIPDETTILHFRHLLEKHQLTEQIFAEVRQLLEDKKLLLKSGTIVDATIISAPSSTKNASQEPRSGDAPGQEEQEAVAIRDEGAHRRQQARAGAQLVTGPANEADITKLDGLLHGPKRSCTAIRRTGARIIGSTASTPGFAIASTAGPRPVTIR